jgi:hypothetical protein
MAFTSSDRAVLQRLDRKIDTLITAVIALTATEINMGAELDALAAEVARNTSVDDSARLTLEGLAAKIDALVASSGDSVDPAALQALADSLRGSTDNLVGAISAITR